MLLSPAALSGTARGKAGTSGTAGTASKNAPPGTHATGAERGAYSCGRPRKCTQACEEGRRSLPSGRLAAPPHAPPATAAASSQRQQWEAARGGMEGKGRERGGREREREGEEKERSMLSLSGS